MPHRQAEAHIVSTYVSSTKAYPSNCVSLCRSMVRARAERRCELCESSIYISLSLTL